MQKEKSNKYKRLNLFEVQAIYEMRSNGKSIREITKAIKRSTKTVWVVINNYCHPFGRVWLKMTTLEKAKHVYDEMRKRRKRAGNHGHLKDVVLRNYVINKLVDEHWSPEAISAKVKQALPDKTISTKTIYNFIKYERRDLKEYLIERGKPRRQRVTHRRGRFKQAAPPRRPIHERPLIANTREEIGHWEGDMIVSKKGGTGGVLTLVERVTRNKIYRRVPNLQAVTVLGYLRAIIDCMPVELRRSITFDNGGEFTFSEFIRLERWYPGLKIYYCDPYCAWQKGSVEKANRDFRWYYPKGTDFGLVSIAEIAHVQEKLLHKPLKCLGYRTAQEVFAGELIRLAA